MHKPLIYSLLVSVSVIVILNLSTGTYFEGYEPIYNALFANEFASQIDMSLFLPNWLGLIPFFSFVTVAFHTAQGYSICATVFNTLILWVLLFSVFFICDTRKTKPLVMALVVVVCVSVYLENLLYVYNLRISFFAMVAAYLLSYVIRNYNLNKGVYIIVLLLAVLGSMARLEIGLLVSILLLLFTILFIKKMLPSALVLMLTASMIFGSYKMYQHYATPEYEALLGVEHIMDDRGGLKYISASDSSRQEIIKAGAMYIQDDPVYKIKDYGSIAGSKGLLEYLSSPYYSAVFDSKIEDLWNLLKPYLWLMFTAFIFVVAALLVYWPLVKDKRVFSLQLVLMLLLIIVLISILNIVVIVPHNIIVCIAISVCMLSVLVLVKHGSALALRNTLLALGCFLIPLSFSSTRNIWTYQQELSVKAGTVRSMMLDLQKMNSHIVFSTNMDESYYPSRLFSTLFDQHIEHYYQEFILSRYPCLEKHNTKFFGTGYNSMTQKFEKICSDPHAVYISNEYINKAMADYMKTIHHMQLSFTEIPLEYSTPNVRAYHVSIDQ